MENREFDLLVAGGGTGGAICAIAAARNGVRTAVVERMCSLGGLAVNSGLTEMNAAGFQGKPLYRGIEKEILDRLQEAGSGEYHFAVAMSSNPDVKIDRFRYDPEALRLILEEMALKSGVKIFYDCTVESAREEEKGCSVQIRSGNSLFQLNASYLVDATGNADLVRALGGATRETPAEARMIATLMFRISNVNREALDKVIRGGELRQIIKEGREEGVLKGAILAFTPIPRTSDVSLNVTRVKVNHEDPSDLSRGMSEARAQIGPVFRFVKQRVAGLENAYISSIASVLGIRDARRIEGAHTLTIAELENMVEFPDTVACGCYPMDIHDPVTNTVIWKMLPGVYNIPYRSLLPKGLHRTIAAGKCLDADQQAFGAVRVMPIVMNIGESAGYAVALAKKKGRNLDELDAGTLTAFLEEKYR